MSDTATSNIGLLENMDYDLSGVRECENLRANPEHHSHFIAVDDLIMDKFPKTYKEDELEEISDSIQCIIKCTVKIKRIGRSIYRTGSFVSKSWQSKGSGIIVNVEDNGDSWLAKILTAKHVLYNSYEAENSEAIVGFDKQGCQWYSAKGTLLNFETDYYNDWSFFHAKINKDTQGFVEIANEAEKFKALSKIHKKYKYLRDKDRLCVLVSHPHGCYKYVSFGALDGRHRANHNELINKDCLIYNTATCKGSSGAFIFALGTDDVYVHSQKWRIGEETFNCSSGPVKKIPILTTNGTSD